MSILPIALIAVAALFFTGSSKKSSSSSKKESDENKDINKINLSGQKPNRDLKPTCLPTEYAKKIDGQWVCLPFWIDGETDFMVEKAIKLEMQKIGTDWSKNCEDIVTGDMGKQFAENPIAKQVVINVIVNLWNKGTGISKSDLPPTSKSPEWVKTVWYKVRKIYRKLVCDQTI